MSEGMESGSLERSEALGYKKNSYTIKNKKDGLWTSLGSARYENKLTRYSGVSNTIDEDTNRSGTTFFVHKIGSVHDSSQKDHYQFKNIGPRGGYTTTDFLDSRQNLNSELFLESVKSNSYFSLYSNEEFIAATLIGNKLKIKNQADFHATLIHNGKVEELTKPISPDQKSFIKETVLLEGKSKLVFYSAELGEYFTDEDINKTIHLWEIDNPDKDDPEAISKVLCDEAIQRARSQGKEISRDITAMIIDFDVPEKGVSSLTEKRSKKSQSLYHRGLPKAA